MIELEILSKLAYAISVFLPLSVVLVIVGGIVDARKKQFHWTKYALIFFVVTIILMAILIFSTYQITNSILE